MLNAASNKSLYFFYTILLFLMRKHDKRDGERSFDDTGWPKLLVPRLNASCLLIVIFTTFPSTTLPTNGQIWCIFSWSDFVTREATGMHSSLEKRIVSNEMRDRIAFPLYFEKDRAFLQ